MLAHSKLPTAGERLSAGFSWGLRQARESALTQMGEVESRTSHPESFVAKRDELVINRTAPRRRSKTTPATGARIETTPAS